MRRPKITKQLLSELCGNDSRLLGSVHHGLYEAPLREIYPVINLDDLIVFSASSWNFRRNEPAAFHDLVSNASLYEIFHEVYNHSHNPQSVKGFVWLYQNRKISLELQDEYSALNPFRKKDLELRLKTLNPEVVQKLKDNLQAPVNEYLFESDYNVRKREHSGDNSNLVVMWFQPFFREKGIVERKYAVQVMRMLKDYPREYSFNHELQTSLF